MRKAIYPEFTWLPESGLEADRLYTMFDPDISRIGYDTTGDVKSVICPQWGTCSSLLGCLNVEVTVTHVRGWINPYTLETVFDIKVEGKIWLNYTDSTVLPLLSTLIELAGASGYTFPDSKANAIIIPMGGVDGQDFIRATNISLASFDKHPNDQLVELIVDVSVKIGSPSTTGLNSTEIWIQNQIVDIVNSASDGMWIADSVLEWEIYTGEENMVETQAQRDEYMNHVVLWGASLGTPTVEAEYYNDIKTVANGVLSTHVITGQNLSDYLDGSDNFIGGYAESLYTAMGVDASEWVSGNVDAFGNFIGSAASSVSTAVSGTVDSVVTAVTDLNSFMLAIGLP